jgi:IS30 family transposase
MAPLSLVEPVGRYLSFADREEIALGRAAGQSIRAIARLLGRPPSTVSRELSRYDGAGRYKASVAQAGADRRARRPKASKIAGHPRLRAFIQHHLATHQ